MIYKETRSYYASDGTYFIETWIVGNKGLIKCIESRFYDPNDPELEALEKAVLN